MQNLRRLSGRRRARRDAGCFVIDGPTLVGEALSAGVEVVEVYAEPGADDTVLAAAIGRDVPIVAVQAGALAKVTEPVTPQSIAALATIPRSPAPQVAGLVLVLVEVGDPGNAGTLVRSAEAAGASAVVSCGNGVDPWSPKCVRASAGSVFRMPVREDLDTSVCITRMREAGMTIVALDLSGASSDDVDLTGDVALVLGNEAHGLDPDVLDNADQIVRIPMRGSVESLNVAMAGTVLAMESARQRRLAAGGEMPSSN